MSRRGELYKLTCEYEFGTITIDEYKEKLYHLAYTKFPEVLDELNAMRDRETIDTKKRALMFRFNRTQVRQTKAKKIIQNFTNERDSIGNLVAYTSNDTLPIF